VARIRVAITTIRAETKCGGKSSCVGDISAVEDQGGCNPVRGSKYDRGDLAEQTSNSLDALRNDDVRAYLLRANRRIYPADLMQQGDTGRKRPKITDLPTELRPEPTALRSAQAQRSRITGT
jgi:hypothetical protein